MKTIESALRQLSETRWNYWMSYVYDGGMAISLAVVAYLNGVSVINMSLFFVFGVLFFTLIEYIVHAHIFHGSVKSLVKAHAKHHKDPMGYDAMPFFFAQFIIAPFYGVAILVFGFDLATIFASGVFVGYITYGLTHFAMHRSQTQIKYFRYMINFHEQHHNNPKMNHGVTVPIWDMIFKTYEPLKNK